MEEMKLIIIAVLYGSVVSVLSVSAGLIAFSFFAPLKHGALFVWQLIIALITVAITILGFQNPPLLIYLLFVQQMFMVLLLNTFVLRERGENLFLTISTLGGKNAHLTRLLFIESKPEWRWLTFVSGIILFLESLLSGVADGKELSSVSIFAASALFTILWGVLFLREKPRKGEKS